MAYVAALYGPRFFSTVRFVKIWATFENFFGQMVYRPPWQKISRTPMLRKMLFSPSNALKKFSDEHKLYPFRKSALQV